MKITVASLLFLGLICGNYAAVLLPKDLSVRAGPECLAPNGGGLQPVLEEFVALLPVEELAMIYLTAVSSDPEVQEVMAWLESDEFHKIFTAVLNAPEFGVLVNYACDELYLDAVYYINLVGGVIGLPPVTRPPVMRLIEMAARARPGLRGLLEDILEVLPMDKIKALFEEKMATDEYVKKGIELLKSEDFKNIFNKIQALPEFEGALNKLRGMGIEVDEILELLKKLFGWGS